MIYVIRHGESDANLSGILNCKQGHGALTRKGRNQAQSAANWFADKNIHRIYASPFERAQNTARIIAKHLDLDVTILDELRENDCGDLEGETFDDAWEAWVAVFERWKRGEWEASYPAGESLRQAYDRFYTALKQARSNENTIMVSHGGITRAVIPFMCVNAAALQRVESVYYSHMILLKPYDMTRFECVSWGLKEHLPD